MDPATPAMTNEPDESLAQINTAGGTGYVGGQHVHNYGAPASTTLRVTPTQYIYNFGADASYMVSAFTPTSLAFKPGLPLSHLLLPEREVTPYWHRPSIEAELTEWMASPVNAPSVRLIVGPLGAGKTRLTRQFAQDALSLGWGVICAYGRTDSLGRGSRGEVTVSIDSVGLLVIAEFVDGWKIEDLISLVRDHQAAHIPVRVLMTARSVGMWWQTLSFHFDTASIEHQLVTELTSGIKDDDCRDLYDSARKKFSEILGADAIGPSQIPLTRHFRSVLAIQMKALADVVSSIEQDDESQRNSMVEVTRFLVKREQAYWAQYLNANGSSLRPTVVRRVACAAIMLGPTDRRSALSLLVETEIAPNNTSADEMLQTHSALYPQPGMAELAPLGPDRLAEDFLALAIYGHGYEDIVADSWTRDSIRAVVEKFCDRRDHLGRMFSILIQAALRWPHLAVILWAEIASRPDLVRVMNSGSIGALVNLPGATIETLNSMVSSLLTLGESADGDLARAILELRIVQLREQVGDDFTAAQAKDLVNASTSFTRSHQYGIALQLGRRALVLLNALPESSIGPAPRARHFANLIAVFNVANRPDLALVCAKSALRSAAQAEALLSDDSVDRNTISFVYTNVGGLLAMSAESRDDGVSFIESAVRIQDGMRSQWPSAGYEAKLHWSALFTLAKALDSSPDTAQRALQVLRQLEELAASAQIEMSLVLRADFDRNLEGTRALAFFTLGEYNQAIVAAELALSAFNVLLTAEAEHEASSAEAKIHLIRGMALVRTTIKRPQEALVHASAAKSIYYRVWSEVQDADLLVALLLEEEAFSLLSNSAGTANARAEFNQVLNMLKED